jgi:hypothetical protein
MASSTHRKFIIHLLWKDIPAEGQKPIEFCPYHINMLNALEETAEMKVSGGKLTEHSHRHWTFEYHNKRMDRPCEIDIVMTDMMLSDTPDWPGNSGYRKPTGPRFK